MKELKARLNNGNIKLGNMGTFSKLMGNDEYKTPFGSVNGSCGHYCDGCKKSCYVKKSYRYPSVIMSHARNTLAIRNDIDKAFSDIDKQISNKKVPFDTIRIHQSGEIETAIELFKWVRLSQKHKDIIFYTYTKNFNALKVLVNSIENGTIDAPKNLIINISVWHEYGIKEYNDFKKYDFIKAFVYMDGFDYNAYGLKVETVCTAYINGKLNHAITCDKCKKCFNSHYKIIGCHEH